MNFARSANEPIEFGIAGSFLLARAFADRLYEAPSLLEACQYVVDLLTLLLNNEASALELPESMLVESVQTPAGFCCEQQPDQIVEQYILSGQDGHPIGRLRLFFSVAAKRPASSDMAFVEFAVNHMVRCLEHALDPMRKIGALTPAERRVLDLLDLPTQEILDLLGIGYETFRSHCKHLYKKLGVHNRQEALLLRVKAERRR